MKTGQKIKKLRELKNFTQEYMANKLSMTQPNYSRIELGETEISITKLEKIADILELNIKDIIGFNEHTVFNIMHRQEQTNTSKNYISYQNLQEIKNLYEEQINILKVEVEHLKLIIEKLLANK